MKPWLGNKQSFQLEDCHTVTIATHVADRESNSIDFLAILACFFSSRYSKYLSVPCLLHHFGIGASKVDLCPLGPHGTVVY